MPCCSGEHHWTDRDGSIGISWRAIRQQSMKRADAGRLGIGRQCRGKLSGLNCLEVCSACHCLIAGKPAPTVDRLVRKTVYDTTLVGAGLLAMAVMRTLSPASRLLQDSMFGTFFQPLNTSSSKLCIDVNARAAIFASYIIIPGTFACGSVNEWNAPP